MFRRIETPYPSTYVDRINQIISTYTKEKDIDEHFCNAAKLIYASVLNSMLSCMSEYSKFGTINNINREIVTELGHLVVQHPTIDSEKALADLKQVALLSLYYVVSVAQTITIPA